MDVFISWSGERSKRAAEALHAWLPKLINAVKPWLSAADINKGSRWASDVAAHLESAKVGIVCLTPGNLHSEWILFEAGALSKTLQSTYLCPLLIGLKPSDVKGPLAQFQATRTVKDEMLCLVKTINAAQCDAALSEKHIDEVYEVWWPALETDLNSLPPEDTIQPERSDKDLLEEILGLVRSRERAQAYPSRLPRAWLARVMTRILSELGVHKVVSIRTFDLGDGSPTQCSVLLAGGQVIDLPIFDMDSEDSIRERVAMQLPLPVSNPQTVPSQTRT